MEGLLKAVTLSPETDRVLGEIRSGAENALYGAESVESEELFHKHVASLIEGAGLPVLQEMHYRWFLRELARLWRTRQGRDLAFHLELCIRKWVGLGLEAKTLQFLVCEAHCRLKGKPEGQSGNGECRTESAADTRASHSELVEESRLGRDPSPASGRHSVSSAPSASSAVLPSGTTQSAKSADGPSTARPSEPSATSASSAVESSPDTGILDSSTPGPLS